MIMNNDVMITMTVVMTVGMTVSMIIGMIIGNIFTLFNNKIVSKVSRINLIHNAKIKITFAHTKSGFE